MTTTDATQTGNLGVPKRLILCCDGTWMDSLGKKSYEPPSNVTRISRGLRRNCANGTHQIINYYAGVGTAGTVDQFTGGAFGMGLDADIRAVYNFICANYVDGDEIILIGFSRGAFTARSVADMIGSVGLLTPEGLDRFYRIFDDYENIGNTRRSTDEYLIPDLPEYNNTHGTAKTKWETDRMHAYKQGLKNHKYTRDTFADGATPIKIKALAVFDTVGTLGIPPAPVIGVRGSADQWRFTNTQISDKVENAFQALGLDEPRYAFRPSLWERLPGSQANLKQVWFPGTHANVGGGWYDQQLANITLAWMADQLSTIGIEFNFHRMTAMFNEVLCFSAAHPFPFAPQKSISLPKFLKKPPGPKPWGVEQVFHHPFTAPKRDEVDCDGNDAHPPLREGGDIKGLWQFARPWGLGQIRAPTSVVQTWAGKVVRRPGFSVRVDEDTGLDTAEPLLNTAETIHSSVRVRLACGGLGVDDRDTWACESLLAPTADGKPSWRLERSTTERRGRRGSMYIPPEVVIDGGEYPAGAMYKIGDDDSSWKWVYQGGVTGSGASQVPQALELPEEPLEGFWERYLLAILVGEPDVWKYAFRGLPKGESSGEKVSNGKRASLLSAFTGNGK
ncbi:hypothetical protein B0T14DRAFT_516939 [Immersiella caudata]|uniref:T6SS Phospholipase effector Tle1-like catalytic domain-containing protein n=1 Tax=Immersiella caudata TaxID=314043 RepID=A0AA40C3J8_9PEZI|nr:hypothetical protein B0T14DRAFT_516939 [Immersiella caudata]